MNRSLERELVLQQNAHGLTQMEIYLQKRDILKNIWLKFEHSLFRYFCNNILFDMLILDTLILFKVVRPPLNYICKWIDIWAFWILVLLQTLSSDYDMFICDKPIKLFRNNNFCFLFLYTSILRLRPSPIKYICENNSEWYPIPLHV